MLGKEKPLQIGDELSYILTIYDRDTDDIAEWKQTHMRISTDDVKSKPSSWPVLVLKEDVPIPPPVVKKKTNIGGFKIGLARQTCKIFEPNQKIVFDATFQTPIDGGGYAYALLRDYYGKTVFRKNITFDVKAKGKSSLKLDLGQLPRGYYTLDVVGHITNEVADVEARQRANLGVADKVK